MIDSQQIPVAVGQVFGNNGMVQHGFSLFQDDVVLINGVISL
jgi:hypothetical protein